MWDWVDLLGRRFKSLWNPPDSLPWVLSMPQEGSTPDTFGFSSSTEVIALWAKTAKQQHSHLRDFSKSNLKLKADPEFLDHKSEQGVLGQTQIGEALRAIKKKKNTKTNNHTKKKPIWETKEQKGLFRQKCKALWLVRRGSLLGELGETQ